MKISKFNIKKPSFAFMQKFVPNTKRKLLLLIILLTAFIAAGFWAIDYFDFGKKQDREISQKLEMLNKDGATCEQAVKEIGGISANSTSNENDKRVLLERQMGCFADQLQYDKAIVSAEELKAFYSDRSDDSNTERLERNIQSLKELKEYHDSGAAESEGGNAQP